jgi:hypothetical protein
MKKSNFKSNIFYWAIVIYLCGLVIWNSVTSILSLNPLGLIPIAIQITLLGLILTKHKFAKTGILVWSILVLILASAGEILGRITKCLIDGFRNTDYHYILTSGVSLLIGIAIVIFIKTIQVEEVKEQNGR